ncbi:hypothetical protein OIU78_014152 [Salix suchowensis]|nr:hypothetical protein OIU78_014152 [Salix suchowensis]
MWVLGFQGTTTHSSQGHFVMLEEVVSEICHLWCLLRGRQGFVTPDMTITGPHFLEACFLCKKPLGDNRDIFMYRGDMPFCSEECRQEQIDIDEAKEKNWNLSSSMKALRKIDQKKSTSPSKAQDYSSRTGTVAAG